MKVLIIRPDAMGDVILSLPMANELKSHYPDAHIVYLASAYTRELLLNNAAVSDVIDDVYRADRSLKTWLKLLSIIRAHHFDVVIFAYNEPEYAALAWLAKIPVRIGDRTKLVATLFLNRHVDQRYGNLWQHEVNIHLRLLRPLGINVAESRRYGFLTNRIVQPPVIQSAMKKMTLYPPVVIHVGLANGNLPIPLSFYEAVIEGVIANGYMPVLTGSPKEALALVPIMKRFGDALISVAGETTMLTLIPILSMAKAFIGTTTGPLHLAAALGVPVVAILPSKLIKATRWGPYGVPAQIVEPRWRCPRVCNPYTCKTRECIDHLNVDDVLESLERVQDSPQSLSVRDYKRSVHAQCIRVIDATKEGAGGTWPKESLKQDAPVVILNRVRFVDKVKRLIAATQAYYPPILVRKSDDQTVEEALDATYPHD